MWSIYGLIDPRDWRVFYVGASTDVNKRVNEHLNDSLSAAWSRCQEILRDGELPMCCVMAMAETRLEAKVIEGRLMLTMRGLVNRVSHHGLPSRDLYPDWPNVDVPAEAIGIGALVWSREPRKRRAAEKSR